MILSKERASQIITLASREHWDGSGLREQMTPEEQARVTGAMMNARRNLSFNDTVRALARGERIG